MRLNFYILAISAICPGNSSENKSTFTENMDEIINASKDFMEGLYCTLKGLPFWKIYKTTSYKKLETSHELIFK